MCGRYVITSAPAEIRNIFLYCEQPNFPPRYNIAPTQPVPIVRQINGARHFSLMRWGLIPSWVKDLKAISVLNNARGESVHEKPAFRHAIRRRRCLFPADGFYEWKQDGRLKRPHFVRSTRGPIGFAGLWETWIGPNGEEVDTACIITITANQTLSHLHHRMPVVIEPEAFGLWLDCRETDNLKAALELIKPAADDLFEVFEVSAAVNRVANDCPDLIGRIAARELNVVSQTAKPKRKRSTKDDGQASLF